MDEIIPKLREEIEISTTGEDNWTLFDRATNKYYRLKLTSFVILSLFSSAQDKDDLLKRVNEKINCTMGDIEEVISFCKKNFLVIVDEKNINTLIDAHLKLNQTKWYTKLIHGYLFFKIHLFNPDLFIEKTIRFLSFVYTRPFYYFSIFLFSISLVFILNRFSEFFNTLTNFATIEGIGYLFISIATVKLFHEFGHAYAAKKAGCMVPSMGIAFMVFYPMPYTDTSDAWKMDSKTRMGIALAGIKTELLLSIFAMQAWLWLPDGFLKSLSFFIIAVSMISTLAINLTPYMRFDGYYALSDYMRIENMHTRSFVLAKAFIKKIFLGIDVPVENFSSKTRIFLILFAFSTWLYRLILFSGIAYLVYSHTFKILGIILFWIEIWYFILKPIISELKEWYALRSKIRFSIVSVISSLFILLFLLVLSMPFTTTIRIPAVIESNSTTSIYAEYDSQIIFIRSQGKIKKGELIISAISNENELGKKSAKRRMQLYDFQSKNAFISQETLHNSGNYKQYMNSEATKIDASDAIKNNMNIYATQDGILSYDYVITKGQFIGLGQKIGRILNPNDTRVTAYIEDIKLSDIKPGSKGKYFDHTTLKEFPVHVVGIQTFPTKTLIEPLLNSNYKGPIVVGKDNNVERSQYKATFKIENNTDNDIFYKHLGEVKIEIETKSFIERIANKTISIFIKESEF